MDELRARLPFSAVDSYKKTLPYLKKPFRGIVKRGSKRKAGGEIVEIFSRPEKKIRRRRLISGAELFKAGRTAEIFKHWDKTAVVFNKKTLPKNCLKKVYRAGDQLVRGLKTLRLKSSRRSLLF